VEVETPSIIGVKQGGILGPILFVMYMAAVVMISSWRKTHHYNFCVYRTKPDFELHGSQFSMADSMYADDNALVFCSRSDVDEQVQAFYDYLELWGMEAHAGTEDKESKTEATFFPAPLHTYAGPSTFKDQHDNDEGADLSFLLLANSNIWGVF
jgi:hypothetical protein